MREALCLVQDGDDDTAWQVLFAICHDKAPLEEVEKEAGKVVSLKTSAAGGVTWEKASDSDLSGDQSQKKAPRKKLKVDIPRWCGKWVVGMDEFKDGVVGAKSKNLAGELLTSSLQVVPVAHFPHMVHSGCNND